MSKIEVNDEIGTFRIIPDWVADTGISFAAFMLYFRLKQYARNKSDCYPGKTALAQQMNVSERHVATLLQELETCGCITIEKRSENGKSLTNLYTLLAKPGRGELQFKGEVQFQTGVNYSSKEGCTTVHPKEKKIKEKKIKDTETGIESKPEGIEEFVSKVKRIYPARSGNMGWIYFTQRAATHFKTAKSKEDFLLAVQNYKNECAKLETLPRHVMMPSSFIAKHYDYIKPTQESDSIFDGIHFDPGWGEAI